MLSLAILCASAVTTNVVSGEQYVWTGSASNEIEAAFKAANAASRPLKYFPTCINFQAGFGWLCVSEYVD